MKFWKTFRLIGALFASFAVQTGSGAAAKQTWNLYSFQASGTMLAVQSMQKMVNAINAELGDELEIRIHLAGSLPIDGTNITQAVRDNIVQMAEDAFAAGNVPITGLLRLPMLVVRESDMQKAMDVMLPYNTKAFDEKGIVLLGTYLYPQQTFYMRDKVTQLSDLKGKKIRTTSREQAEFVKRLGAIPVTLGGAAVPAALDRGVVTGVVTASAGGGKTWKDFLKYNYRLISSYFDPFFIVNKAAFESISPHAQDVIRRHIAETMPLTGKALHQEEIDVVQSFIRDGIVVTEPTDADVKTASDLMTSYWEDWAKATGPEAVEGLAKVRAAIGR
jgi:TRAP-type C4-dicarboxylate transport system substrate-binding protein